MLAVPLILWLAGQGLGTVLGSLGNLSGALASNPGATQAAAASAFGGWLGTRHPTATERATRVLR